MKRKTGFLLGGGLCCIVTTTVFAEPYLLWRHSSGANQMYQLADGQIQRNYQLNQVGADWFAAGVADFDGDGQQDIWWRHQTSGENYIHFLQDGQLSQSVRVNQVPAGQWQLAAVGDFDGDGNSDVLWRNQTTGLNYVYLMNGHLIAQKGILNTVSSMQWQVAATGDFDGDGKDDLLWRNQSTGVNFIYLMNGLQIAKAQQLNVVSDLQWTVAATGDFNQDQQDEILWRHQGTGMNAIYSLNGAALSKIKVLNVVADQQWQVATVGDLNQDGTDDILWRNQQSGLNFIYWMGNNAIQSSAVLNTVNPTAWQLVGFVAQGQRDEPCVSDMAFFTDNVQPILNDCVACHVSGGVAGEQLTDIQFQSSAQADYLTHNFQELGDFARQTSPKNGEELLLTKPLGVNHVGGQRWEMTTETAEYLALQEMIQRFKQPTQCDNNVQLVPLFDGVTMLDNQQVLRKAAMLFGAAQPTEAQLAEAAQADAAGLKALIRQFMQGDAFKQFVMEGANNQLLTDKYLNDSTPGLGVLPEWYYPNGYELLQQIQADTPEDYGEAWWQSSLAVAREPLQLFAYVADQERPYTEVLTADYILVNYWSNAIYSAGANLTDPAAVNEWAVGHHNGHRMGFYPRAGVLNSPIFLNRYPSTATNRNRARSRWTYQFFLGVDIEALAQRPTDPAALQDKDNPTMNNPNCAVCHTAMDPVAGAFQNYGDEGYFLNNDLDSLPWSYKESDLFVEGDRWYRDMRLPGFNGNDMPNNERDHGLQWLAQQIISDPRFGSGTVKFWWQAVFGEDILLEPLDTGAADYALRRQAYDEQQAIIAQLAQAFVDGAAGTATHGAYNLKDLLLDMVMTPWFRAAQVDQLANREVALDDIGYSRLLTPEQLSRKYESLTGYRWGASWRPDATYLTDDYRTFYGGIDSDGLTDRVGDMNSLMTTVIERMANETACHLTAYEFVKPKAERLLFPLVDTTDIPDDAAGTQAILANIQYLHQHLLGEVLPLDAAELQLTYQLFTTIRDTRIANGRGEYIGWGDGFCHVDWDNQDQWLNHDPNHTARAWMAVLIYMFNDYRFLYL